LSAALPARRHAPDLGYADIERQMRPIIVKQPNAAPLSMTAPRQARPPCPKFSDLRNVPACDCRPNPRILELSRQGLGCRRGRLDQAVSGTPWSSAMKSLTTIALAAALFAGATTASAQNATPTTKVARHHRATSTRATARVSHLAAKHPLRQPATPLARIRRRQVLQAKSG